MFGFYFDRYARDDTHYLLYVYDLMKKRLLSSSTDPNNPDALLVEVSTNIFRSVFCV